MKKITGRTYFRAFLLTSLPMVALSYLWGGRGVLTYAVAFGLGMMFQADITLWEFAKILWDDFKREVKYWNCRLRRHKLTNGMFTSDMIIFEDSEYAHCPKCKAFLRTKARGNQPTRAFLYEGIECTYCKKRHPFTAVCMGMVNHIQEEVRKREQL